MLTKILKLTLLYVLCCFTLPLKAQNSTYSFFLNYPLFNSPMHAWEDSCGNITIHTIRYDSDKGHESTIFTKISPSGTLLKETIYDFPNNNAWITDLLPLQSNYCIGMGHFYSDSLGGDKLWIVGLDSAFNLLWQKQYDMGNEKELSTSCMVLDHEHNIISVLSRKFR